MEHNLWKYCEDGQIKDFLVSLDLFAPAEMKTERQIACLYGLSNHMESHYYKTSIRKKDGTRRYLSVPDGLLKKVQRNIVRHILNGYSVSPYATAYKKGGSVRCNAASHVGQPVLLKLDISDFFGSILFYQVYSAAFPAQYFPPAAAVLLTNLCCYKERLPQGAPTSAPISNLVMKPFDSSMGQWCRDRGITYTRYCDDMTFSGDFDVTRVKNKVRGYLDAMGFALNEKKTRVERAGGRQLVTGLSVNEKVQTTAWYRRQLRQEIYYCKKFGTASHLKRYFEKNGKYTGKEVQLSKKQYLQGLLGKLDYIQFVNPSEQGFAEDRRWLLNEIQAMDTFPDAF